jgi:hypothetical protein
MKGEIGEIGLAKDRWQWGVGSAVALQLMVDITCVARADFWEIPCDIYHTAMEA